LPLVIALNLQNEVSLLSKIRHQNIIKLLGYCIHGESRFLVYEYMESGSLESQLHGTFLLMLIQKKGKYIPFWGNLTTIIFSLVLTIVGTARGSSLTWYIRLRIAIDVAR